MSEVRLIDENALAESDIAKLIDKYLYNQCNLTVGLAAELMSTIEPEALHRKRCEFCKGRSFTNKPITVITRTMKRVEVVFNFCPKCGRDMRVNDANASHKEVEEDAGTD